MRIAVVVIGALVGLAVGIGSYTFLYAKGYSYLTSDPAACARPACVRCHWDVGHMT